MLQNHNGNKGMTMIEILVVIFILGITLTSLLSLANLSLGATSLVKQTIKANLLAQEIVEAVRNFRDETSWDINGLGTLTIGAVYHPEISAETPKKWNMISGEKVTDIFTQKVVFERVLRDGNYNIADSGTEDADTRKIIATISWQERGRTHHIELVTYLTNWQQ